MSVIELFNVCTTVKEYRGYKDVIFSWFYWGTRLPRRPYALLIENYRGHEEDYYPESAVDELFTEDEACQLKDYLDRVHGLEGTTTIGKAPLPVQRQCMGIGDIPVGGPQDFLMLETEPEYSLPFKARGYFDLRQHEAELEPEPAAGGEIPF